MRGLLLFIAAKLLIVLLYIPGFVYSILGTFIKFWYYDGILAALKAVDNYLFNCAYADDQHANAYLAKLLNDTLIKPGGHKFGNPDETLSSVLGKNKLILNQSKTGTHIDAGLEKIDNNHTIKSIEKDEQ